MGKKIVVPSFFVFGEWSKKGPGVGWFGAFDGFASFWVCFFKNQPPTPSLRINPLDEIFQKGKGSGAPGRGFPGSFQGIILRAPEEARKEPLMSPLPRAA